MADKLSLETEKALAEFIAQFYCDPLGFVMAVFPWGRPGTPLADKTGPEPWQRKLLKKLGEHITENKDRQDLGLGLDLELWQSAVASGHGVGKSAFVAWVIYFLMSTRRDTRGVVTANTGAQLESKTWPELSKWHAMAINKHWFTWTSTAFFFAQYPEDRRKNYMVNAITVSEDNTEAFAGLHNEGKTVFVIMDEASGISEKIYEVVDGALTDGEAFLFQFGNPTRPTGPFYAAFNQNAHLYSHLDNVDSREVSHTNKLALQKIIDKYGEDSEVIKYRVKGQFPSKSYDGFLAPEVVTAAMTRELYGDTGAPLVLGIDVARFGDDSTIFAYRQGRDARTLRWLEFHGLDTVQIAEFAAQEIIKYKPDAVVIEAVGPGIGVIDVLKHRGFKVIEAYPGAMADDHRVYQNKRVEWWVRMREWLTKLGCVPEDKELYSQLTEIMYVINPTSGKMQMEKKEDMKGRGLSSPDKADALALTFAATVQRRDARAGATTRSRMAVVDYDPLNV